MLDGNRTGLADAPIVVPPLTMAYGPAEEVLTRPLASETAVLIAALPSLAS